MPRPQDEPRVYRPRRAAESPLYRIVSDAVETYIAQARPDARAFCAEEALRRFLGRPKSSAGTETTIR